MTLAFNINFNYTLMKTTENKIKKVKLFKGNFRLDIFRIHNI